MLEVANDLNMYADTSRSLILFLSQLLLFIFLCVCVCVKKGKACSPSEVNFC